MGRLQGYAAWKLVLILLAGVLGMGCASQAKTGAFVQVDRLESELRRGVSTKMDVQRVLGAPRGQGSAIFPTDPKLREVWFYQGMKTTVDTDGAGALRLDLQQQILLVFFEREVFDGFMWFWNGGVEEKR
ncbi:MAG: hypothetical protein HYY20_06010 [Candidatus Tectomicrobia bacterium]|uniref:Lipoprotein SmpA/OmlA domain-containing protein n=1 Tax=Tectimicrobiota bacterium TaxID=2528274 RepID=A0A932FWK2_UNCTE|nr:hypothetical protein [Candidatus Tectomicrobia bacterium]